MKWFFSLIVCSSLFAKPLPYITEESQLISLFPTSVEQIKRLQIDAQKDFESSLKDFINFSLEEENFTFVLKKFDQILGEYLSIISRMQVISFVTQKEDVRNFCFQSSTEMKNFYDAQLLNHSELFYIFQNFTNTHLDQLNSTQKYYLENLLKMFVNNGVHLSDEKKKIFIQKTNRLNELSSEFQKNINEDQSYLKVTVEDLDGMSEGFISQLPTDQNKYKLLYCNYPTVFPVLQNCRVAKTRKDMAGIFFSRAYPQNHNILQEMIRLRDEKAKLLGYQSFAEYKIVDQMALTVDRVEQFLLDLYQQCEKKQKEDLAEIKKSEPSVILDKEGKIFHYDNAYLWNQFYKKNYDVDSDVIRQYFPLEKVLESANEIFGTFFSLDIENKPMKNLWAEDVCVLKISKNKKLLGYVLLDLFPRKSKYGHACEGTIIPAWDGDLPYTAVSIVIANFSKPTLKAPSLLSLQEVRTFFHELGHALHDVLGRSEMILTAGTSVKRDFVEMPSQIFEEWLWEPEIIKKVSSHYITQKPLSDDIIKKIIQTKEFGNAEFIQRQCFLSFLSLEYFKEGESKDLEKILFELCKKYQSDYSFSNPYYFYTSFGHLDGYGPIYYGYLWARSIGIDMFEKIKAEGLLDSKVGEKFLQKVLQKGGNQDPEEIVKNYLGRPSNVQAMLNRLKINKGA